MSKKRDGVRGMTLQWRGREGSGKLAKVQAVLGKNSAKYLG